MTAKRKPTAERRFFGFRGPRPRHGRPGGRTHGRAVSCRPFHGGRPAVASGFYPTAMLWVRFTGPTQSGRALTRLPAVGNECVHRRKKRGLRVSPTHAATSTRTNAGNPPAPIHTRTHIGVYGVRYGGRRGHLRFYTWPVRRESPFQCFNRFNPLPRVCRGDTCREVCRGAGFRCFNPLPRVCRGDTTAQMFCATFQSAPPRLQGRYLHKLLVSQWHSRFQGNHARRHGLVSIRSPASAGEILHCDLIR